VDDTSRGPGSDHAEPDVLIAELHGEDLLRVFTTTVRDQLGSSAIGSP
jgi:hypothetical protein